MALCALAACGATARNAQPDDQPTLPSDALSLRKLMHGSLTNAGIWFADPACQAQFARPSEVQEPQLDAFAKCLADLHMHSSNRRDPLPDVAVLSYAPGLEVEVLFAVRDDEPQLLWIGPTSHRDRNEGPLSITPAALDALRIGDDSQPLVAGLGPHDGAWIEVCLDETGAVKNVRALDASSVKAANAIRSAALAWKFQPFALAGMATHVCSLLVVPSFAGRALFPYPNPLGADGSEPPVTLGAGALHRVSGDIAIQPDDATKVWIQRNRSAGAIGAVQFCIDEKGHVTSARMIRPTGYKDYDRELLAGVKQWDYAPHVEDGVAIRVCAAANFIYSQYPGMRSFVPR